jgi:cytochrome c peroxidase
MNENFDHGFAAIEGDQSAPISKGDRTAGEKPLHPIKKALSLVILLAGFVFWMLTAGVFDLAGKAFSRGEQDLAVPKRAGDQAEALLAPDADAPFDSVIVSNASRMIEQGRQIFRFDTFGDEAFWGDALRLHQAIAGARLGGVGPGLTPRMALALGLKVDLAALPDQLVSQLRQGQVNLDDPATTVALLKLNAVVGVTGFFNPDGSARSMGIQCAICHSTVDNAFTFGIGNRLDGWANRDLNIGAIVALAPNLKPFTDLLGVDEATVRTVLNSWGPGKFDAELILDGKAFRPDGKSAATLIPPAFGLAGVNLHTWTGWGSVTHWNAFVSNLEMHGKGTFYDPRLNNAAQFPIAARAGFGNVRNTPDLITAKLAALHFYQLAIPAPRPPQPGLGFGGRAQIPVRQAQTRGEALFNGKANCASCHVPPLFTEPGWNMHTPAEIGIDDFQANRSPDRRYRTAPLKGLWTHQKGGFYHDGRFPTLEAVVEHYNVFFNLGLSREEVDDLVEYLRSI